VQRRAAHLHAQASAHACKGMRAMQQHSTQRHSASAHAVFRVHVCASVQQ
jgi:hypothetical protein